MKKLISAGLLAAFVVSFMFGAMTTQAEPPIHIQPICDGGYYTCDSGIKLLCCPIYAKVRPCKGPDCREIVGYFCKVVGTC